MAIGTTSTHNALMVDRKLEARIEKLEGRVNTQSAAIERLQALRDEGARNVKRIDGRVEELDAHVSKRFMEVDDTPIYQAACINELTKAHNALCDAVQDVASYTMIQSKYFTHEDARIAVAKARLKGVKDEGISYSKKQTAGKGGVTIKGAKVLTDEEALGLIEIYLHRWIPKKELKKSMPCLNDALRAAWKLGYSQGSDDTADKIIFH